MNDEIIVRELFRAFLTAVTEQDTASIKEMADRSLAVHHIMLGKSQSGEDFISDVSEGRFRLFSADITSLDLRVIGDSAFVIGRFTADCAICGMERSKLQLCMKPALRKSAEGWKFTDIRISESAE